MSIALVEINRDPTGVWPAGCLKRIFIRVGPVTWSPPERDGDRLACRRSGGRGDRARRPRGAQRRGMACDRLALRDPRLAAGGSRFDDSRINRTGQELESQCDICAKPREFSLQFIFVCVHNPAHSDRNIWFALFNGFETF